MNKVNLYIAQNLVLFEQDGLLSEEPPERATRECSIFSTSKQLRDGTIITISIEFNFQSCQISICFVREKHLLEGVCVHANIDTSKHQAFSDEFGEVLFIFGNNFSTIAISKNDAPEDNLLILQQVKIGNEDTLLVLLEEQDDGLFTLSLPEYNSFSTFDGTIEGFVTAINSLSDRCVEIERGKTVNTRKLVSQFQKFGFRIDSSGGKGSHQKIISPDGKSITVPFRSGGIAVGTLHSILRQANITFEELMQGYKT
jgi:predicted RNA binding protein YcfA (HicA-like mRNA interferase family)